MLVDFQWTTKYNWGGMALANLYADFDSISRGATTSFISPWRIWQVFSSPFFIFVSFCICFPCINTISIPFIAELGHALFWPCAIQEASVLPEREYAGVLWRSALRVGTCSSWHLLNSKPYMWFSFALIPKQLYYYFFYSPNLRMYSFYNTCVLSLAFYILASEYNFYIYSNLFWTNIDHIG